MTVDRGQPTRHRACAARAIAALALVSVISGCTGTSRSSDDYRHKAANAAQAADSTVNIAQLDAELVRDHKTLVTELRISLQQAYSDASSTLSGFDAVLPPRPADVTLQHRLDTALSSTVALLLKMRVLAGQGREGELPALIPQLQAMSTRLKHFEDMT